MRRARIKAAAGEADYHCVTRTVNGERLFDDPAKEILRRQLWQVADYCGVKIITYAILSNHFHVLLRVPKFSPPDDAELLRRFTVLYPKPTRYQTSRLEVIRQELTTNGPDAVAWRQRQLALMGDVSQFMKLLKQRFSIWFNRTHNRFGTLWAERFKSVLVEPKKRVTQAMAAYIDLNCVRAGLATDPKDYRFCGYAEAVAGHQAARDGLLSVASAGTWAATQAAYRQILFGTGTGPRASGGGIAPDAFERVLREGGKLPLATLLRCRVRHFTDGVVLGSRAYVARHLADRRRAGKNPKLPSLPTDWGELVALQRRRRTSTEKTAF